MSISFRSVLASTLSFAFLMTAPLTPAFAVQPNAVTASRTITSSDADTIIVINAAAGLTLTLPASTGSGYVYRFFVQTTVTSGNDIIQVANASDVMQGNIVVSSDDAANAAISFETVAASDTITLNGTTKCGLRGDFFEIRDAATNLYTITGLCSGNGTEVTMFSAAV